MKKILMLAACTAAMTAITSCSSNDDDVLPQASDAGKAVVDTKCPFNFIVGMDNGTYTRGTQGVEIVEVNDMVEETRASVVSTNPFNKNDAGFNLWGFQTSTDAEKNNKMMFSDAKTYSFNGSSWTAGGEWPTGINKGYFYALSYAGKSTTSLSGSYLPTLDSAPSGTSYSHVAFTYTLPLDANNNLALDDATQHQEDILVACNLGQKEADPSTDYLGIAPGSDVALTFTHALSNLELRLGIPADVYNEDGGDYGASDFSRKQFLYVNSITIHNIPQTGTFTFANFSTDTNGHSTCGSWDSQTLPTDIVINYPTGLIIYAVSFADEAAASTPAKNPEDWKPLGSDTDEQKADKTAARKAFERSKLTPIKTGNQSIMVIPHTITPWADGDLSSSTQTYITINGFVGILENRDAEDDPMTADEKAAVEGLITLAQAGGTWNTEVLQDGDNNYVNGSNDKYQITPLLGEPDVNASDFSCTDYYVKIPAMTFAPNKSYKFNIGLTYKNLVVDEHGKTQEQLEAGM